MLSGLQSTRGKPFDSPFNMNSLSGSFSSSACQIGRKLFMVRNRGVGAGAG